MSERRRKSRGDHVKRSEQIKVTLLRHTDGKREMQVEGPPRQVGKFFEVITARKSTATSNISGASSKLRLPHKSQENGTSLVVRRDREPRSFRQTYSRTPVPTNSQVAGRTYSTTAVHGSNYGSYQTFYQSSYYSTYPAAYPRYY